MNEISNYIDNPINDLFNFHMGEFYESQKHYSPACGFYLRCAELTSNTDIQYEALLRLYICFAALGSRNFTCENVLKQAVSIKPYRPEAYFLLTQLYESTSDWLNVYLYATLGIDIATDNNYNYISTVNFPGKYALIFQKAAAAWWCNKPQEARKLFHILLDDHINELNNDYKKLLESNLSRLGSGPESQAIKTYYKNQKDKLKYSFLDIDLVERNFSQVYQDMFILTVLNGKKNGTYLEIGAAEPFKNNNTALLETQFGWTGIGIEIDSKFVAQYKNERKNEILCADALLINYDKLLNKYFANNKTIDYLQLDIEPPYNTYEVLLALPLDEYQFQIITYEHDYYVDITKSYRDKSRKYLESKGYHLLVNDISPDNKSPFEDWWVHNSIMDDTKDLFKNPDPNINQVESLFLV